MKKVLVSLFAIMVTSGAMAECYGGGCSCQGRQCKPKKYRIIHITANNSDQMYGSPEKQASSKNESEYQEVALAEYNPRESNWYVGGHLDLNLLNFKTKYAASPSTSAYDASADNDSYSFEPLFGGNLFVGYNITNAWRTDMEVGYITKFTDSDQGISLHLSAPYLMGNVYYDFESGLYLGAGLGFAVPRVGMDWTYFTGDSSKTKLSLMGALAFGYGLRLSDNVVLDLRYRLAAFDGPDITRGVSGFTQTLESVKTDVKTVWDNSFSIGIRYEF